MPKINCVYCGQEIDTTRYAAGQPVKCPNCGSDNTVAAGRGRGQRLIEGGDVGHDGQVQLLVNSLDEFLPMVAIGPGAIGTIESYDGGAGSGQGGGGGEIGRDARSRRAIPLLDADDGQLCILPDSRYMFRAVEAQAGGPSANRGHCDAVNGVGVVQRIAGGSLA